MRRSAPTWRGSLQRQAPGSPPAARAPYRATTHQAAIPWRNCVRRSRAVSSESSPAAACARRTRRVSSTQSCPDSTRHRITSRPGRRFVGVCVPRRLSRCFPRPSRALPLRGAGAMERRNLITSSSNPRLKTIRRLRGPRGRVPGRRLPPGLLRARVARANPAAPARSRALAGGTRGGAPARPTRRARAERSSVRVDLEPRPARRRSGRCRASANRHRPCSGFRRPLVLVAEGVERPGNLGTIVRSTCAAGADALVVADGRTDLFHPETVRGSVGTLFRLPSPRARRLRRSHG